jgi:hypothetical protein
MTMMSRTHGNWRVTRNCCTSGNCSYCRGVTPVGVARRIVQGGDYGEAYARWVATNWQRYGAMAEIDLRAEAGK